ncbi:MAG: four helix bundle protein [Balneolales bacterium]|nr:four helix bundle protein [Balneolales bacterium]
MEYKFEKLQVWSLALDLCESVLGVLVHLPDMEKFNLCSQLNRATTSVALNIAEGSTSQSDGQQLSFIGYAIRSLIEVIACLRIIRGRKYPVPEDVLSTFENQVDILFIKLQAFSNYLKSKK